MCNTSGDFSDILIFDVAAAAERARQTKTQESYRSLIRTIFAAVEGLNWNLREGLLAYPPFRALLTPHEVAALAEETYSVTERGKVIVQPKFIPLGAAVRLVVRLAARLQPNFSIDFNHVGWACLLSSIEVRNRIVHPKNANDLSVTDQEVDQAMRGWGWFLAYVLRTLLEHVEHIRELRRRAGLPPYEQGSRTL